MRGHWIACLQIAGSLILTSCAGSPDSTHTIAVESVDHGRTAAPSSSDTADTHVQRGVALGQEGNLDGAIEEFNAAIRLAPEQVDAHVNLGLAFEKQGEWDQAIREYEHAIKIQPDHTGAHVGLGVALQRKGDLNRAIT